MDIGVHRGASCPTGGGGSQLPLGTTKGLRVFRSVSCSLVDRAAGPQQGAGLCRAPPGLGRGRAKQSGDESSRCWRLAPVGGGGPPLAPTLKALHSTGRYSKTRHPSPAWPRLPRGARLSLDVGRRRDTWTAQAGQEEKNGRSGVNRKGQYPGPWRSAGPRACVRRATTISLAMCLSASAAAGGRGLGCAVVIPPCCARPASPACVPPQPPGPPPAHRGHQAQQLV